MEHAKEALHDTQPKEKSDSQIACQPLNYLARNSSPLNTEKVFQKYRFQKPTVVNATI